MNDARGYLNKVGVQASIIDRMYSIDSNHASYLSADELESLAMMPHWEELKIAKCGPEPTIGPLLPSEANWQPPTDSEVAHLNPRAQRYALLRPNVRRHLIKKAEREMCWYGAQNVLRKPAIDEYLRASP
jgi:hypothetical protein